MIEKRLEHPKSIAGYAALRRLGRASAILAQSNVQDDYQLGVIHDILSGNYGSKFRAGHTAIIQAKQAINAPLTHDYLSAAESVHIDNWFLEYDEDVIILNRYLAIRPGLVADAAYGDIRTLTVEMTHHKTPEILCMAGSTALRGGAVDVVFDEGRLLTPERQALASYEVGE